jgi:peptide-methionine (R)-S-oxide reductase
MLEQTFPVTRTDAEWRARLTPEQYHHARMAPSGRAPCAALREAPAPSIAPAATRCAPSSGANRLPSFNDPIPGAESTTDKSHGMIRTEVHCATCGSHSNIFGRPAADGAALLHQRRGAELRAGLSRQGPASA